jgi:hypothetical protein
MKTEKQIRRKISELRKTLDTRTQQLKDFDEGKINKPLAARDMLISSIIRSTHQIKILEYVLE